jgi:hypothetical protein
MSKILFTICTLASIFALCMTAFIIYLTIVTTLFNVKFDITNISLKQFNLTSNNTLYITILRLTLQQETPTTMEKFIIGGSEQLHGIKIMILQG